ncbi:helix-turn-helix transcriptional regulator [Baekduia sp.]|jgi:transcriptional regulator with XRE-family HTH domain|uniref:helix-turn-helix transcriptional regulator n=1 Tax=Baekduia sp. TaxID=2600305 RepID=UPI002E066698|nr:helix-turn-helix transcriptional regulator [Baekduia sp.]
MHLTELLTDDAALAELGQRLARHRVARNRTQAELAKEAGIGRATLQRLERGESVQMTSLIRLLRTLGLLGALDAAIPETIAFPIAQLERERRGERQRVRTSSDDPAAKEAAPWRWGDEAEPTR